MFALVPFIENFNSFTECFSSYWETIKLKCNIALLWLSSLVNSSTQEVDWHTPVMISTKNQVRKSQLSKILPSSSVLWKLWKCDYFSTWAHWKGPRQQKWTLIPLWFKALPLPLATKQWVGIRLKFEHYKFSIQSRWEGDEWERTPVWETYGEER